MSEELLEVFEEYDRREVEKAIREYCLDMGIPVKALYKGHLLAIQLEIPDDKPIILCSHKYQKNLLMTRLKDLIHSENFMELDTSFQHLW